MARELSNIRASRRRVLSSVAAVGVSPLLASVAADPAGAESTDSLVGDVLSLGTFESGLDDWQIDGDLRLSRVGRDDRPVAVTQGERALEAAVEGDAVPAIFRPVGSLDLAARPYFTADVAPGRVEGTDAPVAFRFRLYGPPDLLDGSGDLELIAESDPVTVRQATTGRIYWDASDVDVGLLDAVSRLEIAWSPADVGSDDAGSGDADSGGSTADFTYRGSVVFDAIRATASADAVGSARIASTLVDLEFEHGPYQRTEVTAESNAVEEGEFVFADGEAEPYRFEILGDDRYLFALAGTDVKLGGGWSP
ncbi:MULTISPECIES: hypothetical protein [Halorussus]|uniref:hypothetical protein n=1 Tax=Halorussus TaxID=1070314 RepID=UPI0020A1E5FF|nr:hypothetical protein [Halorussus vallis]USZ74105.1 hypothetical protein NGM07_11645 [Halorussus vallis]